MWRRICNCGDYQLNLGAECECAIMHRVYNPYTALPMNPEELTRLVSDGVDRAKAGDALAVYAVVAPYHDNGALSPKSHYPFGWIIYYAIHQSAATEITGRKRMLARYMQLQVQRPHKLHSMILTQAIRLYKESREAAMAARLNGKQLPAECEFSLIRFTALWGLHNLRPGDWRRKEHEGRPVSSTVEKLITHYCDELHHTSASADPPADFMAVMERGMQKYADSCNILAQRAALHIDAGRREEGERLLQQAVLTAPGKFFLWSRLAGALADDASPRLRIALLYRALSAPGQDIYKGRVRMAMAEAWHNAGMATHSLWELNAVKRLYEANGWHLPRRHAELSRQLPPDTVAADPAAMYRRVEHYASDYLYQSLPEIRVTKNYHKESREETDRYGRRRIAPAAWRVADSRGTSYWLTPEQHGIDASLPHGTGLDIRVHNRKVVTARVAE